MPAWLGLSGGEEFARSFEAQFDEVCCNNLMGQRAVQLVSRLLSSLTVYSAQGAETAAGLVTAELIGGVGAALLLNGNAYVQVLTDGDEKWAELVMLPPERVSVETDPNSWPLAYRSSRVMREGNGQGIAVVISGQQGIGAQSGAIRSNGRRYL